MSDTIDLRILSEQMKRLMDQVATLKTDFDVAAAMLRRLDFTQGSVLDEVRGVHAQQHRVAARLESLEDRVTTRLDTLEAKLDGLSATLDAAIKLFGPQPPAG